MELNGAEQKKLDVAQELMSLRDSVKEFIETFDDIVTQCNAVTVGHTHSGFRTS